MFYLYETSVLFDKNPVKIKVLSVGGLEFSISNALIIVFFSLPSILTWILAEEKSMFLNRV